MKIILHLFLKIINKLIVLLSILIIRDKFFILHIVKKIKFIQLRISFLKSLYHDMTKYSDASGFGSTVTVLSDVTLFWSGNASSPGLPLRVCLLVPDFFRPVGRSVVRNQLCMARSRESLGLFTGSTHSLSIYEILYQ